MPHRVLRAPLAKTQPTAPMPTAMEGAWPAFVPFEGPEFSTVGRAKYPVAEEPPVRPDDRPFRCLMAGQGGIFDLSATGKNGSAPVALGVANCGACVGVFFMLDEKRCFAANISASTCDEWDEDDRDIMYRLRERALDRKLKRAVVERLRETLREDWSRQKAHETLVVVCGRPHDTTTVPGEPFVGQHIMDALAAFFHEHISYELDKTQDGFIVEGLGKEPVLLGRSKEWEGDRQPHWVG